MQQEYNSFQVLSHCKTEER